MTTRGAVSPLSERSAASLSSRWRRASGSLAAVGPGPPDSAAVLVTSTLWPSILTREFGVVGGRSNALSPSMITVPGAMYSIASGLRRSLVGETAGRDGIRSTAIASALRATAWSRRVRSWRTAAETSRSPKGRVSTGCSPDERAIAIEPVGGRRGERLLLRGGFGGRRGGRGEGVVSPATALGPHPPRAKALGGRGLVRQVGVRHDAARRVAPLQARQRDEHGGVDEPAVRRTVGGVGHVEHAVEAAVLREPALPSVEAADLALVGEPHPLRMGG